MKYVPGRKSDVQDCQWLQKLMRSYVSGTSAVELSHKISRSNLLRGEHHAHGSDVHDE
jgi:hypothetical protein